MSALAKRLDRIEAVLRAALSAEAGPIYLREEEAIPEGVALERVVLIKRVFVDPPDMPDEELPETTEPSPAIERGSPSFSRPLPTPPLGYFSVPLKVIIAFWHSKVHYALDLIGTGSGT